MVYIWGKKNYSRAKMVKYSLSTFLLSLFSFSHLYSQRQTKKNKRLKIKVASCINQAILISLSQTRETTQFNNFS